MAAVAATLLPILAATIGLPGSFTGDGTSTSIPVLCLLCGERGTADFRLGAPELRWKHPLAGAVT